MTIASLTQTPTHLIVVAPRNSEAQLRLAGFQPAGRMNTHTITFYQTFTALEIAMTAAQALPPSWTWATEPASHPQ